MVSSLRNMNFLSLFFSLTTMACSLGLYITGLYVLMLAPVFIEIFSGSASFPPNHSVSAI